MKTRWLAGVLALFWIGTAFAADDRPKVPAAAELAKAEKQIKEVYKDDYSKRAPGDLRALADNFLKAGIATNDDLAVRFVFLRESIDLAAVAGDVPQALAHADEMARNFVVAVPELHAGLFETTMQAKRPGLNDQALVEEALQAADGAVKADDFAAGNRILSIAAKAATRSGNAGLVAVVTARTKEANRLFGEYGKLQEALATLNNSPRDPQTHLAAGKYYCFAKGDWDKGLPHLALSGDATLQALADKDLAMPNAAAAKLALADAWYDLGTQNAAGQALLHLRATYWYEQAAPNLMGLNKVRVEKRLEELSKAAEGRSYRGEMFTMIRQAIQQKTIKETNAEGGAFAALKFQEIPPQGAILIGFEIGLGKFFDNDIIDYLRPIFLTAQGEKLGAAYGKPPAKVYVVKARPGFAVGGLNAKGGGGLDGFSMTFMQMDQNSLKKDVFYKSDWFGCKKGGEDNIAGTGSPVIGLSGRKFAEGKIGGLGVVVLNP